MPAAHVVQPPTKMTNSRHIMKSLLFTAVLIMTVITDASAQRRGCCHHDKICNDTETLCHDNTADCYSESALNVLLTRRGIRNYTDQVPSRELLEKVLEAGTYAPTGMGAQSPVIVAVTDRATRDRLSRLNAAVMGRDEDPFYGAPVVFVVLADRSKPTYVYDGALVMGNLMNAARAVGLGSRWIHRAREVFDSPEGKALLAEWGLEGDYEGIGNCIIGYPAGAAPEPKPRKADYIHWVE